MTPPVGASPEVTLHAITQHPCENGRAIHCPCPCGTAVVVICSECGEAVFLAADTENWCVHAEVFYQRHCLGMGVQQ